MNFTREPVIETIISPKDGHKIQLRSSKGGSGPDYTVDAVEIVSFGSSLFFRSLERPQSFLVPVTDFEVSEVRETRVSLKNARHEKSIKIEAGESSKIKKKEKSEDEPKKGRKRTRKKRSERTEEAPAPKETKAKVEDESKQEEKPLENKEASSALLTQLFPPPSSLISETMTRIEPQESQPADPQISADVEENKLDQIWTVDSDEPPMPDSNETPAEPRPPKRSLRKRVKKEVEKGIEESVATSSVVIDDPDQPPTD